MEADKNVEVDQANENEFMAEDITKLRVEILNHSLALEYAISKLLLRILNVTNETLKALGSSNPIPFNQKLALLHDIGYFTTTEMESFNTVMEIRNKFLHNLEIATYTQATNESTRNKIIKKSNLPKSDPIEDRIKDGYQNILQNCLDIANQKREQLDIELKQKNNFLLSTARLGGHFSDRYRNLYLTVTEMFKKLKEKNLINEDVDKVIKNSLEEHHNETFNASAFLDIKHKINDPALSSILDRLLKQ